MRVAIVVPAYHRGAGLERVSVEYARGLRDRGHAVTVLAQSVTREHADADISFVALGGPKRQKAMRAAVLPLIATRAVRRVSPEVTLAFGSVVLDPAVLRVPGSHRSWWEFAQRTWPATTPEGLRRRLNPHHRVVLAWDRLVLGGGRPRAVLAAARWTAEELESFYPALRGKVSILPDGVNLEEFAPDPEGARAFRERLGLGERTVLLTVATELRRKGLGTLAEAMRLVRAQRPDATLVVAGRVSAEEVRALAARHGVADAVVAAGFVPDLAAAYSAADATVFPTRFDPWGLPVIESLACGTPVATSARAGAAEQVLVGRTGFLIDRPDRPEDVARATVDALALRLDREKVRASVEHLAWPRIVELLESTLARAAGG